MVVLLTAGSVILPAAGAAANHVPPQPTPTAGLPLAVSPPNLTAGATRAISNVPAGQAPAAPLGETPPFTRDGRTYRITSSMWYGLQVVDVTNPLAPSVVSNYAASTTCASYPEAIAAGDSPGDVFAVQGGWENDLAFTPDGRIAILGADAGGRCHDPRSGGLELIDVSDVNNPRTLHLTRNVGEAHSVTIDPVRPWLAYTSTSDGADFIDIVDYKSCLGGVAQIDACEVTVARVVFDAAFYPQIARPEGGDFVSQGCHDLRFRGDRMYCAAINATLIFDTSKVIGPDGRLTGTHLTAGPNACEVLDADQTRATGVKITDCLGWTEQEFAVRQAQPATMPLVSWIRHGTGGDNGDDISIAHQADAIADGRIVMITDEVGGGLSNVGGCPGGGVWLYDITDETNPRLMKQPDGSRAVWKTPTNLPGTAHMSCTVHYGSEFADENLLVFGWYLNGMRAVRYDVDFTTAPATVSFTEVAAFTPLGGEVIQAQGVVRNPANPAELIIYSTDWFRGIDILGANIERITRAAAFKVPGGGTQVKSSRQQRNLPATGVGDPVTIALALLLTALAAGNRLRRVPR